MGGVGDGEGKIDWRGRRDVGFGVSFFGEREREVSVEGYGESSLGTVTPHGLLMCDRSIHARLSWLCLVVGQLGLGPQLWANASEHEWIGDTTSARHVVSVSLMHKKLPRKVGASDGFFVWIVALGEILTPYEG